MASRLFCFLWEENDVFRLSAFSLTWFYLPNSLTTGTGVSSILDPLVAVNDSGTDFNVIKASVLEVCTRSTCFSLSVSRATYCSSTWRNCALGTDALHKAIPHRSLETSPPLTPLLPPGFSDSKDLGIFKITALPSLSKAAIYS